MTTQTLAAFVRNNRLSMTVDYADENPNMPDSRSMNHFKVVIRKGRKSMQLVFSQGLGISGEPKLASVLDCLASDASGLENARNFEEWASEYGYDADSRSPERTYRAVEKQAKALRRVLGDEAFNALLWETERD